MSTDPKTPNLSATSMARAFTVVEHVGLHSFATLAIALVTGALIADPATLRALWEINGGELLWSNSSSVALHFGLSALAWGFLYGAIQMMRRPRAKRRVRLARSKGTAIVEMLIITIPFLLLTGGLAQLSINNITGVTVHLAAYQAGRSHWIWEKEAHPDTERPASYSIGQADLQEIVKLSAAAALAPVAPASNNMTSASSPRLNALRSVMYAHFSPNTRVQPGSAMLNASEAEAQGGKQVNGGEGLNFTSALDTDGFSRRAARKLTFAFHAVEDTQLVSGANVGVTLKYKHFQAFPWFGWIFGESMTVGGRQGYYSTYTRTYTVPAQVEVQ